MRLGVRSICAVIRLYQLLISPLLGSTCRYRPVCSDYARQAVCQHGPVRGLGHACARLLRCHPWGGFGYDPVPPARSRHRSFTDSPDPWESKPGQSKPGAKTGRPS